MVAPMIAGHADVAPDRPSKQSSPARRSNKVSEQVARWILDEIVSHQLPEGAALESEGVMIERYGVSRASLREALRLLEVQGALSMKPGPGGGPRVARPTPLDFGNMVSLHFQLAGTTIRELTAAQVLLEPQCAALAATHRSADEMARLDAALRSAREIDPQNGAAWQRESMRFHDLIMEMSHNRAIGLFARSLKEVFTDRTVGGGFHPLEFERINQQHQAIAEAIRDGDAEKAQALMKTHTEMVVTYFGKRYPGLLDDVVSWH